MVPIPKLFCPIRGELRVLARAKDGLNFTEEKRRIECIVFLLSRGYPRDNIRVEKTLVTLGHKGKNSLRADVVVYNKPCIEVIHLSREQQREHTVLVAEIKRDNQDAEDAKRNQLEPALRLIPNTQAVGVYWDEVEQRLLYKTIKGQTEHVLEAPIAFLPDFGQRVERNQLRFTDLVPSSDLIGLFQKIEDALHHYVVDKAARFQVLMQLLLVKMYDEKSHKQSTEPLGIQDFTVVEIDDQNLRARFNYLLISGLSLYQKYLPNEVDKEFEVPAQALREVSKLLAPVNLLSGDPDVIQNFYMYFAKQLYKWDLAQYFTPYEVVDFIVRIINPKYGEDIKDPACGSADFLTSAYRYLQAVDDQAGDRVWGADSSRQAVQISILNMLLNDDGKSNIKEEDSLLNVNRDCNKFKIMLCNPPFGVKIVEKRPSVLANFDLGRGKTQQETGILFTELCVKQATKGGRIAIILPNGYLGNKSEKYLELRRWLLKHTFIVAIIAFPRFTFKKSGADVSASAVFLEKRKEPLPDYTHCENYPVHVNMLESVGWDIGNKKAKKVFKRDPETGAVILDTNNEPVLDADFDEVLQDLHDSAAANRFRWLIQGKKDYPTGTGWSIASLQILEDKFQSLDPKRLNRKYKTLLYNLEQTEHLFLGTMCSIMPEGFTKKPSEMYRYVEIAGIHERSYEYSELRGWQLPGRAKHLAQPGDIYVGSIWSSVGKWFIAGDEVLEYPTVVTNGCYRLRLKDDYKHYLPDLVFALSSEFYRVQMRAIATGSDGLADISQEDLASIRVPIIDDPEKKQDLNEAVEAMLGATRSLASASHELLDRHFKDINLKPRKSNFAQV